MTNTRNKGNLSSIDGPRRGPVRRFFRFLGRLHPLVLFVLMILIVLVLLATGVLQVGAKQGDTEGSIDMNSAIIEDIAIRPQVVAERHLQFVASVGAESDRPTFGLHIPGTSINLNVTLPVDNLNNSGAAVGFYGKLLALIPEDSHHESLDVENGIYHAVVDEIVTDYAQIDFGSTNIPPTVKKCEFGDHDDQLQEGDLDPANVERTRLLCYSHAVFANQESVIGLHLLYQSAEYAVASGSCMENLRQTAFQSTRQLYEDHVQTLSEALGTEIRLDLDLSMTRWVTSEFQQPPTYENININITPQLCSGPQTTTN